MADSPSSPIVRVRGLVNRFGAQVVHDGLDHRRVRQRDIRRGRRFRLGQIGAAAHDPGVAPAAGRHRRNVWPRTYEAFRPSGVDLVRSYGVTFQNGALISSLNVAQKFSCPCANTTRLPEEALAELGAAQFAVGRDCRRTPPKNIRRNCPGAWSSARLSPGPGARTEALVPR